MLFEKELQESSMNTSSLIMTYGPSLPRSRCVHLLGRKTSSIRPATKAVCLRRHIQYSPKLAVSSGERQMTLLYSVMSGTLKARTLQPGTVTQTIRARCSTCSSHRSKILSKQARSVDTIVFSHELRSYLAI